MDFDLYKLDYVWNYIDSLRPIFVTYHLLLIENINNTNLLEIAFVINT